MPKNDPAVLRSSVEGTTNLADMRSVCGKKFPYVASSARGTAWRIETSAAKRKCSASELFRLAIESYLERDRQRNASDRRYLRGSEYTQVALDAIIRENYPKLREPLVQETDRRMKVCHGAG